ncbi:MAG: hypothetical protein V1907_03125 [Candidatus Kerfeldbacteria bacterium]
MSEDLFGVVAETGADVITRYVVVEPVLAVVKAQNPELYLDCAHYALVDPHMLTFFVAGFNTVLDVATNRIPFVRKSSTIRKIKKEILGQMPRAIIAHFNQHQNEFQNIRDRKPTFTTQDQVVGAMRKVATDNVGQLGSGIMAAIRDLPHKIHDTVLGGGQKKVAYDLIRELHFAVLESLEDTERGQWGEWAAGLDDRGQEVLRESLPSLLTEEAVRMVLALPAERRIVFLMTYAKEGPLEDFWQGVRSAVEEPMNDAVTKLDAAIKALD